MDSSLLALFVAFCLAIPNPVVAAAKVTSPNKAPKDAILLSKVESLTFRGGKMTTSRRVSAVPQLKCVGPKDVCKLYDVDVMRCTNEGADYDSENIQWACRADLPEEFKLGSTDVACEGYASSDDPYVLKGSCGVEYRLLLTDEGERRFGRYPGGFYDDERGEGSKAGKIIFFVIFLGVCFVILKGLFDKCRSNPPRLGGNDRRSPWFGGGGGGDDGSDDAPPPYDSHSFNNQPKKQRSTANRTYGIAGSSRNAGQQQQGWRPNPWVAGLAGAGLGYAFGQRNNNRTPTQPRAPSNRAGGGFFGGGSPRDSYAGPSNSGSPSGPSFSSSRHESTGFGGTSRR